MNRVAAFAHECKLTTPMGLVDTIAIASTAMAITANPMNATAVGARPLRARMCTE